MVAGGHHNQQNKSFNGECCVRGLGMILLRLASKCEDVTFIIIIIVLCIMLAVEYTKAKGLKWKVNSEIESQYVRKYFVRKKYALNIFSFCLILLKKNYFYSISLNKFLTGNYFEYKMNENISICKWLNLSIHFFGKKSFKYIFI